MENEKEIVTLVAGLINATGKMLYWKAGMYLEPGDYAIVENGSGYDLIKVIGTVTTKKSSAGKFSNTKFENMKNVVKKLTEKIY